MLLYQQFSPFHSHILIVTFDTQTSHTSKNAALLSKLKIWLNNFFMSNSGLGGLVSWLLRCYCLLLFKLF